MASVDRKTSGGSARGANRDARVTARMEIRRKIEVSGIVQGVGFRFFVIRQASELALDGWVANRRDGGVECVAEGPAAHLDALLRRFFEQTTLADLASGERRTDRHLQERWPLVMPVVGSGSVPVKRGSQ